MLLRRDAKIDPPGGLRPELWTGLQGAWRFLSWAAASTLLGACLFPVIDFEERTTPGQLSYREAHRVQPRSEAGPVPVPGRRPAPAGTRRASVIAPLDPAPERNPNRTAIKVPEQQAACYEELEAAGLRFARLPASAAPGVHWPIRLRGAVRGVNFQPLDPDPVYAILDCRLGLSLVAWASDLRRAGVRRVDYYSMYRPGARIHGNGATSSHAYGLAIDAARFTLDNGVVLGIQEDWEGRRRGQPPCPVRREESRGSRLLRSVTCSGIDQGLFQIALTPHYNKAHGNHVHLERKPEVDWTYVR